MASNQLTTTSNSLSSQTVTQSPQTATGSNGASPLSGSVQPGTAVSLLNSNVGMQLHGTALTTINLSTSNSTSATPTLQSAQKHHIYIPLFGLSALLVLVAIVLLSTANRSVKTTT